MSTHVTWALVGFGIALLFIWVYHMLKKRGFRFFWYHPLFTGLFLLFVLYLLERMFADLSDFEVQESWNMLTYLGIPLAAGAIFFIYRSFKSKKKL
ncbi:MAG: hypothetical protein PHI96_00385 [Desulfovibrio sp.]|nr:hypothetical protein [Desulfovibrio sp.]